MSGSLYDEMREVLDRREAAEKAEAERASNDDRFAALDSKLDAVLEVVKGSAPASRPPGDDGSGAEGDPPPAGDPPPIPDPPPDPPPPELPVEVVTRLPVPRIYTGDDEPSEVRYTDPETGEEKTRAGRRKGHPSAYSVEPYEPPEPPAE